MMCIILFIALSAAAESNSKMQTNNGNQLTGRHHCYQDLDCPPGGFKCVGGICKIGYLNEAATTESSNKLNAEVNSSGISCESQSDCPDNFRCVNGICWFGDNSTESAGSSTTESSNNLDAEVNSTGRHHCYQDLDCPPGGFKCVGGICKIGYLNESSGSSTTESSNEINAEVNSAGIPCESQSDCPDMYTCVNGTCWFGDNSTESPQSSVAGSENKQSGAEVNSSAISCESQSDCPDNFRCVHGTCWFGDNSTESSKSSVTGSENKPSGTDVNSSAISCESQSDCPDNFRCVHGTCWFGDNSTESPESSISDNEESHYQQEVHI